MALSQAQIKGRIKNLAKTNKADARILMRIYMMERFLERLAKSAYAENFINMIISLCSKNVPYSYGYQKKYIYASGISFEAAMKKAIDLYKIIR